MPEQRVCVFCGRAPVSLEHVWPDWLLTIEHGHTGGAEDAYGSERDGVIRSSKGIEATVKRVCEPCNNEWMSDIENASKHTLIPLMYGLDPDGPPPLTTLDQAIVARWAYKTALIIRYFVPRGELADKWYTDFYRDKTPPPNCFIWAAACEAKKNLTNIAAKSASIRMETTLGPKENPLPLPSYDAKYVSIAYHFNHLALRVLFLEPQNIGHENVGNPKLVFGHGSAAYLIWPSLAHILPWAPNRTMLTDEGFESFAADIFEDNTTSNA